MCELLWLEAPAPVGGADRPRRIDPAFAAETEHILHGEHREPGDGGENGAVKRPVDVVFIPHVQVRPGIVAGAGDGIGALGAFVVKPPAGDGVVVVCAGVGDKFVAVVVGEEFVGRVGVERELEHGHPGEAELLHERDHAGGDDAQVFGDDGQFAEPALEHLEQAGFAGMAMIIACMGLFGLVSYTASQRTKEIGVRKVLGASISSLVALLSMEFVMLVGLAFLVATPLAYFAMKRWLDGFAYRIDIGPEVFLFTGAIVLLIVLATVSYHSIKYALADPVKSLRYE